jgi:L-fuculose-phosphate aldolase
LIKSLFGLKNDIISVGKRMYDRGYIASNDGNISARIDERKILITPTGVSKGFMAPDDLIVVDYDGKVISGTKKPTSEMKMHLQVYKSRADVNSVCHSHPPYATGFAVAGIPLDKCILPEVIITLGGMPLIEYGTPSTEEFYKPVLPLLKDYDAFLLANHGVVTVGKDVISAYHKMETVEHFAHIAFVAQQLGYVNTLNKEQVQKLTDLRKNFGVRTNAGCVTCDEDSKQTSTEKPKHIIDNATEEMVKRVSEELLKQLGGITK